MSEASFPLFDQIAAREAAESGIAQATVNKGWMLEEARKIAAELGRRQRFVTADDVVRVYSFRYPRDPLGNAAGSLFKDKTQWRFADRTVESKRVSAHCRLIRVWEYVGEGRS